MFHVTTMPSETTLSDFVDADPSTPAARLQAVMENPVAYDFGESVFHGGSPVGMGDAKQCDDQHLLRQYADFLREECPGDHFADAPGTRRAAKHKYEAINRVEARIEKLEFPAPSDWPDPLDTQYLDFVDNLDYPRDDSPQFDWYGWAEVDSLDTETLQFLYDAYTTVKYSYKKPAREPILRALLYYRPGGGVGVADLFDVSTRGKGAAPSVVKHNIAHTLDRLHPVIGALLTKWVDKVTTKKGSKQSSGWYTNRDYGRRWSPTTINIRSDTRIRDDDSRSTTAHELGHALHYLYGLKGANGDAEDAAPKSWPPEETLTRQDAFRTTVMLEWGRLQQGEMDSLRSYQTENVHEFLACAFECWVTDSDQLANTQPRLKTLFDSHFGLDARPGS